MGKGTEGRWGRVLRRGILRKKMLNLERTLGNKCSICLSFEEGGWFGAAVLAR